MNCQRFIATMTILLSLTGRAASAAVVLGAPFGEHMVLQQGVPVTIWGSGCPGGDTVRVSFAGQSVMTKSDWQGKWSVQLAPMKAGGPYQMLVEVGGYGPIVPSPAANATGGAELNDVLVGEVVHSPAQLNATASTTNTPTATEEQADDAHPYAWVRVFSTAPLGADAEPSSAPAQWRTVPSGAPSGDEVLKFARALHDRLHVPIGVVEVSGNEVAPPSGGPAPPN